METTNREYRDRLFKFIFGNPNNKAWTLSLYNAINGSSYTDPDDIQLTTLEDAVYMGMKNDVSFLVADTMSFYEQQSTFNPNMPMRFLIYAGMVYSRFVKESKEYNRYSPSQQFAPTPKCVCLYNGTAEKEDRIVLKLSDSFKSGTSDIEVTVTMINVNYGHNNKLMADCELLKEYAWFVDGVREHQNKGETLENAVDLALDEMPESFNIKPFLIANKAEVKFMCITEYDEEELIRANVEEGIRIGEARGRAEGEARIIAKLKAIGMSDAQIKDLVEN
jgi:predicted transposase/invertase (TIGR01784 family)